MLDTLILAASERRGVLASQALRTQAKAEPTTTLRGIGKQSSTLAAHKPQGPLPFRRSRSLTEPLLKKVLKRSLSEEKLPFGGRMFPKEMSSPTGGLDLGLPECEDVCDDFEDDKAERALCLAFCSANASGA